LPKRVPRVRRACWRPLTSRSTSPRNFGRTRRRLGVFLRLRLGGLPTDPEASGEDARLALRQSLALRVLARVAFAGAGREPFSMRF
jgi:hypothetical protein